MIDTWWWPFHRLACFFSLSWMNCYMHCAREANSFWSWKAFLTNFSFKCGCIPLMTIYVSNRLKPLHEFRSSIVYLLAKIHRIDCHNFWKSSRNCHANTFPCLLISVKFMLLSITLVNLLNLAIWYESLCTRIARYVKFSLNCASLLFSFFF